MKADLNYTLVYCCGSDWEIDHGGNDEKLVVFDQLDCDNWYI